MQARYKGFCVECSKPIYPGQEIAKKDGAEKYTHVVCPTDYTPSTKTADGYRKMAARFDSVCVKCGGEIAEGDTILWKKGEKAFHAACAEQPVRVTPAPRPQLAPRPAPRRVNPSVATRQEQHETYIDVGPQAWDDRDPEPEDFDW